MLTSTELFQISIFFKKVTYVNMDGIWAHGSAFNAILLLEVLCGFPGIAGDLGAPRIIAKAR